MSMEPSAKQDGNQVGKSNYKELLIGCGAARKKILCPTDHKEWLHLVTLDVNANVNPDIQADLENLPYTWSGDNEFNEIHAYEVMEHIGSQGDYKFFFKQFNEFGRILKPDGLMFMTYPKWNGLWAFGDPGHTRVLTPEMFQFLDRNWIEEQQGRTHATDYCYLIDYDWELMGTLEVNEYCYGTILKVSK